MPEPRMEALPVAAWGGMAHPWGGGLESADTSKPARRHHPEFDHLRKSKAGLLLEKAFLKSVFL